VSVDFVIVAAFLC